MLPRANWEYVVLLVADGVGTTSVCQPWVTLAMGAVAEALGEGEALGPAVASLVAKGTTASTPKPASGSARQKCHYHKHRRKPYPFISLFHLLSLQWFGTGNLNIYQTKNTG